MPIIKSDAEDRVGIALGSGSCPKFWGFPSNICTMAEASDFKFDTHVGFAKAHHEMTPE